MSGANNSANYLQCWKWQAFVWSLAFGEKSLILVADKQNLNEFKKIVKMT